ncbi:MAG: hypothetical protein FJZ01_27500 [Candidatus Sericytochromatia bacterium]|nr:hypothetical protein [Candidatus Tanganyikabacteria bacterium]
MNRGGSWNNDAQNARAANRNNNDPGNRNNNLGFRLSSPGAAPQSRHGASSGVITVAPAVPPP